MYHYSTELTVHTHTHTNIYCLHHSSDISDYATELSSAFYSLQTSINSLMIFHSGRTERMTENRWNLVIRSTERERASTDEAEAKMEESERSIRH